MGQFEKQSMAGRLAAKFLDGESRFARTQVACRPVSMISLRSASKDIATQVGAPSPGDCPKQDNVMVVFTTKPDQFMADVRDHHDGLVGYHYVGETKSAADEELVCYDEHHSRRLCGFRSGLYAGTTQTDRLTNPSAAQEPLRLCARGH